MDSGYPGQRKPNKCQNSAENSQKPYLFLIFQTKIQLQAKCPRFIFYSSSKCKQQDVVMAQKSKRTTQLTSIKKPMDFVVQSETTIITLMRQQQQQKKKSNWINIGWGWCDNGQIAVSSIAKSFWLFRFVPINKYMSYVCANNVIFVYRFVESLNLTKNIIETNDLFVIELYATMPFFFCSFIVYLFIYLWLLASSPPTTPAPPPTTTTSTPERPFLENQSKNIFDSPIFRQRDNTTIQFTDKGNQSYNFFLWPLVLCSLFMINRNYNTRFFVQYSQYLHNDFHIRAWINKK